MNRTNGTRGEDIRTWTPRLKLILGKGGFNQLGAVKLRHRARNSGARRIGAASEEGWFEIVLDGVGASALPVLTEGLENWVAFEYPRPYSTVLHVKTEGQDKPVAIDMGTKTLLDLGGKGVVSALATFLWIEPRDMVWAEQALREFKEAAKNRLRPAGVES